ncbi:hypothetical protein KPLM21_450057 [Klebsiella pneumoniae]|nr:hypothetical protein KPLM21_450057 [Klebsiella pneumoniae]SAL94363.1 hypothetical protein KPHVMX_90277 [Klebsiella pneumoniae]
MADPLAIDTAIGLQRFRPGKSFMLSVASAHIALPVNRLRYAWHSAGSAQGAASRRCPLYPRARASKNGE